MQIRTGILTRIAALAALAAVVAAPHARAESYPDHPIKMIVSFPAGGGADVLVRILAKHMDEDLGQTIVVENKPGAGGAIAYGLAARAAADGYTLVWTTAGYPVMAATVPGLTFDPDRAFVHICDVAENPFVLVVNPKVPATSVKELVALAKAKPDTLNFANNGVGTLTNLTVELLKLKAGIHVAQIPYRGDNFSSADVMAGNADAMFSNSPVALPHIHAGQLRGLAVTSPKRSPAAPDIPTMQEAGVPDFSVVIWQGFSAPVGTPRPVIDRLNASARKALQAPEVIERFQALGAERIGSSPEEFQKLVGQEMTRWADVVKQSGVKVQ
ncbi:MAG TPA: tripartite tricarboxylate transporter substrate binding protein [Alphaproteobacteria bacterium]|nr:tripartite tricarboxylate transporter substrate binding protein [Alphaproteobacteria bacterium]